MAKKSLTLIFLTLVLVITQLTACSKGGEVEKKPVDAVNVDNSIAEAITENDEENPDLPDDVNYGGYTFKVINTLDEYVTWLYKTLIVEEETGEALNDAIYKRNSKIEEQYGIKLVQIGVTDPEDGKTKARTSILANTDEFDLLMARPASALTMAQEGLLVRIDEIPYIDLSKPYWDQDMNRDFSIDHRLYFTSGDFSFNQYTSTIPIFFNKKLLADLGLEDPYQLVKSGKWTLEKFAEMAKVASRDLNGDQQMTFDDQWGFLGLEHNYTLAFMCGSGAKYVTKGSDDIPYCTIGTENFINIFNRVYDVTHEGSGWFCNPRATGGDDRLQESMFMNNQSLFWSEIMNWASVLREMESDFGILPYPKFDEQQKNYISSTGTPHVMCVPVTTSDVSRTGIVLEALCAESRKSTKVHFYDTMLKSKIIGRDDESGEMLDIIFSNRMYEIGRMYWDGTIASPVSV